MNAPRWNPKTNNFCNLDRPMYKTNSGKYVRYLDYKELADENIRLKTELTAALMAIGGVDGTSGNDRRSEAILSLDKGEGELPEGTRAPIAEALDGGQDTTDVSFLQRQARRRSRQQVD